MASIIVFPGVSYQLWGEIILTLALRRMTGHALPYLGQRRKRQLLSAALNT